MKATSGAHIFKVGSRVVKIGSGEVGKRVCTQAHYCQRFDPAAFPHITKIFSRGCVMERLDEYMGGTRYIHDVTRLLRDFVWCHPSNDAVDWYAHLEYVITRAEAHVPGYVPRIADLFYDMKLEARDLRHCRTHGDPTYDNMMQRGHAPVLIDPLPPYVNGEMPALAAVDVGKIMQSLLGYEAIKYGSSLYTAENANDSFVTLHDCLPPSHDDWVAAHWFLVTHIVRLIPYQPPHNRTACVDLLRAALRRAEALCE